MSFFKNMEQPESNDISKVPAYNSLSDETRREVKDRYEQVYNASLRMGVRVAQGIAFEAAKQMCESYGGLWDVGAQVNARRMQARKDAQAMDVTKPSKPTKPTRKDLDRNEAEGKDIQQHINRDMNMSQAGVSETFDDAMIVAATGYISDQQKAAGLMSEGARRARSPFPPKNVMESASDISSHLSGHGYTCNAPDSNGVSVYKHKNGSNVMIGSAGNWSHVRGKGLESEGIKTGTGMSSLKSHMKSHSMKRAG